MKGAALPGVVVALPGVVLSIKATWASRRLAEAAGFTFDVIPNGLRALKEIWAARQRRLLPTTIKPVANVPGTTYRA